MCSLKRGLVQKRFLEKCKKEIIFHEAIENQFQHEGSKSLFCEKGKAKKIVESFFWGRAKNYAACNISEETFQEGFFTASKRTNCKKQLFFEEIASNQTTKKDIAQKSENFSVA